MLNFWVVATLLLVASAPAAGDVVFRGNYWRDRNTRVIQPEADFSKELPTGTIVGGHYLLDAITSASAAAGVVRDQPFTELRNEFGIRIGQRLRTFTVTGGYSYSSESDYWAHLFSLAASVDLWKRNTTLALNVSYGSDSVAMRMGPTTFAHVGGLQTFHLIASWTQALTPKALADFSYELGLLGFGDAKGALRGGPTIETGYQSNPYRTVLVGGMPTREHEPYQRIRQTFAGSLHLILPTGGRIVPYVAFRPGYRLYFDDWGVLSNSIDLRTFLPFGPFELRVTGRYYTQRGAVFWREVGGKPSYARGAPCTTCIADSSRQPGALFYTGDPKLSPFDAMFFEVRLLMKLSVLKRHAWVPLGSWLSGGLVEISYGHYFDDRYAHTAYGDAELAGFSLTLPL